MRLRKSGAAIRTTKQPYKGENIVKPADTALDAICRLDWGTVTPEFAQTQTDTFVHVFNHSLLGDAAADRAIRFAVGRVGWYNRYLGRRYHHIVVFDDRGQAIREKTRKTISKRLKPYTDEVRFTSKER